MEDLLKMKERIESEKLKKAKLEGQLESLEKELSEKFGCESLEEAENKLKKLEDEIQSETSFIEKSVLKLKEKFNV